MCWFRRRFALPKGPQKNLLHCVVEKCPLCEQDLSRGHRTWELASAIAGTESANRLLDLIAQRKWREAAAIREFHVMHDDVDFEVLCCEVTNKTAVLKIWLPFELYDPDRVVDVIHLDPAEVADIDSMAQGQWEIL
jgi:hypothetical protein